MNPLDWALRYLADGYSVIPLKPDKRPLLDSWKEFQTRQATEDEVRNWWAMFPNALVGIVTGKISGLCVVDVEDKGDSSIFPPTYTVRTGRGGLHLYYEYAEISNMVRVFPLVDVRGDGGYIVAPPSITSFTGKSGAVEGGEYTVIDDAPKMPFPIALFQRAQQGKFDAKIMKGVEAGGRNQSAASMAGYLLARTKPSEYMMAWELLKGWNSLNKPPLDNLELKTTFESIMRREVSKDKEKPTEALEIVPLKVAAEANRSEVVTRIPTGFDVLDDASRGGMGAGELWVIAAPQGQGKTTLAMEMTLKIAQQGKKSLWLSYELLVEELWDKFTFMGAPDDFLSYTTLKPATGDINVIEKTIKKAVEQEGVSVVFIDHFGRLGGRIEKYDSGMSSNYATYLALIAARLKELSLQYRVTIILMAHTKKPARGQKQTTSDIANTSGLGNEATMSIILEREVDFNIEDGDKYTGKLLIKVDKSRWGKETVKMMTFESGRIKMFDPLAKTKAPPKATKPIDF